MEKRPSYPVGLFTRAFRRRNLIKIFNGNSRPRRGLSAGENVRYRLKSCVVPLLEELCSRWNDLVDYSTLDRNSASKVFACLACKPIFQLVKLNEEFAKCSKVYTTAWLQRHFLESNDKGKYSAHETDSSSSSGSSKLTNDCPEEYQCSSEGSSDESTLKADFDRAVEDFDDPPDESWYLEDCGWLYESSDNSLNESLLKIDTDMTCDDSDVPPDESSLKADCAVEGNDVKDVLKANSDKVEDDFKTIQDICNVCADGIEFIESIRTNKCLLKKDNSDDKIRSYRSSSAGSSNEETPVYNTTFSGDKAGSSHNFAYELTYEKEHPIEEEIESDSSLESPDSPVTGDNPVFEEEENEDDFNISLDDPAFESYLTEYVEHLNDMCRADGQPPFEFSEDFPTDSMILEIYKDFKTLSNSSPGHCENSSLTTDKIRNENIEESQNSMAGTEDHQNEKKYPRHSSRADLMRTIIDFGSEEEAEDVPSKSVASPDDPELMIMLEQKVDEERAVSLDYCQELKENFPEEDQEMFIQQMDNLRILLTVFNDFF